MLSERIWLMALQCSVKKSDPVKQRGQGVACGGEGHFKCTCLQKRSLSLIRSVD